MRLPLMPPEKAATVLDIIAKLRSADLTIRDLFLDPAMLATDERVTMIRRAHHHATGPRTSSHEAIGMLLDYIDKQQKVIERQSARIRMLDNLDDL